MKRVSARFLQIVTAIQVIVCASAIDAKAVNPASYPAGDTSTAIPFLAEDVGGDTTVLPPREECSIYSFKTRWEKDWGISEHFDSRTKVGKKLSCLDTMLKDLIKQCKTAVRTEKDFVDDCVVAGGMMGSDFMLKQYRIQRPKLHPVKTYGCLSFREAPSLGSLLKDLWSTDPVEAATESTGRSCSLIHGADFLLDNACNSLSSVPKNVAACDAGSIMFNLSPISLLLDGSEKLKGEASVVSFPLDPRKTGKKYVWHASETAPLLVLDPNHTGKIESATQLFGTWTMGGKPALTSTVALSDSPAALGTAWRDGYEALATFDKDSDGEVSGSELASLALWFDTNRNGISDAGEVKPLHVVGIARLFYRSLERDAATGHIYAANGFEQISNGQIRRGTSVDWFGEEGDSEQDLAAKLTTSEALGAKAATKTETNVSAASNGEAADAALESRVLSTQPISGMWRWAADGSSLNAQNLPSSMGYFVFNQIASGEVSGYTIAETPFREDFKLNSAVSVRYLSGTAAKDANGATVIRFAVVHPDGSRVDNVVHLEDANHLSGQSVARIRSGGKTVSVTYRWDAERVDSVS